MGSLPSKVLCLDNTKYHNCLYVILGGEAREVLDWLQSFWGGACLVDQQCLTPLSRCDHSSMLGKLVKGKFGECTPVTETTAIGIGIGLLLLKACIIMICCSICRRE